MLARPSTGGPIRTLAMLAVLTATWLLWSGLTVVPDPAAGTVEVHGMLVAFMVGSIALTLWLMQRMDAVDRESSPLHITGRFLVYFPWLVKEIVLSNLHVAQTILDPELPIQPQLVRLHTSQSTDVGHVVHANSITITPGTVSLDVRDGTILVHALTNETAAGLKSGEMDRRVTWVEGD